MGRYKNPNPSPRVPIGDPTDRHSLEFHIAEHLDWSAVRGYSESTISTRKRELDRVHSWLAERGVTPAPDVADRLDEMQIGLLTQTMQVEVLDTLEQLIGAVQQMQRENEQQQMQPQQSQDDQNTPLLPTSAELKLLRASQLRVNSRTQAIEQTRSEEGVSAEGLSKVIKGASRRQMECTEIAEKMRERIDQP